MDNNKVWDTKLADEKFSRMIRKRDMICVACRIRPSTDCSHFWERHHSATRYDPRNGDGLCRECHQEWEGRNNGYGEYKRDQLGSQQYDELFKLAHSIMQRETAIWKFMLLYKGVMHEL